MRINQVIAVRTAYKPYRFTHQDVYQLRADRKHVWLQKLCFRILNKLGANWIEDRTEVNYVQIDSSKFMRNIFTQIKEIQSEFQHKPKTILIGSEDYHKLMDDKDFHAMFRFEAEYHTSRRTQFGEYVGTVDGLSVQVIPWMQGILVLP